MSFNPGGGGGSPSIGGSTDVFLSSPTDTQILVYDTATTKWINASNTPSTHAASHSSGQTDEITIAQTQVTNLTTDLSAKVDTTALDALFAVTDAVLRWDGVTGSQPLRSTVTTDANRRVRWVQPTAPPSAAGYALSGDVWERSV